MTLNNAFVDKRTQLIPKGSAAEHMHVLMRGFLATCTVLAAEAAAEVPMLHHAEDVELSHAASNHVPMDESLAPRPVAVTLLAYGDEPSHCNGARVFLDALGHLASAPLAQGATDKRPAAARIRFTVLAGVDAKWFAKQAGAQGLYSAPNAQRAHVDVCVRWAVPAATPGEKCTLRAEFKAMPIGLSATKSLEAMQNCFLSMKMAYDVPFPHDIASAHSWVPNDAWAKSVHEASDAFFKIMEGPPCVYKGEVLRAHEDEVNMEAMGVFVRICPRTVHDPCSDKWMPIDLAAAVTRPDAFHAFLVGNAACKSGILELCKQHQRFGLPPTNEDTAAFCLHTCAVQANSCPLRDRVSLYATHAHAGGRTPGAPIVSPGSWVWRTEAAVVALEQVLPKFYVIPCSRDSVTPQDRRLEQPFDEFFDRAYTLYTQTFGQGNQAAAHSREFERPSNWLPSQANGGDPAVRAAEEYALTAFGLDASTRRIAVGDAFATLKERQAPAALTDFMLQSSLYMGINTSLIDALDAAATILANMHKVPASERVQNSEAMRLKRIADAAICVTNKRGRTLSPSVEIEPTRVRALLNAAGLRKGRDCWLKNAETASSFSSVVEVLSSMLLRQPCETATHEHACQQAHEALKRARKSGACEAELASLSAAITVLRGSHGAVTAGVFVVAQRDADDQVVSFNRILPGGAFEKTTPGHIIDSPLAMVLLLKICPAAMRVTATARE